MQLKLRYFYQLEFKPPIDQTGDKRQPSKQSEVLQFHSLSPGKLEKQVQSVNNSIKKETSAQPSPPKKLAIFPEHKFNDLDLKISNEIQELDKMKSVFDQKYESQMFGVMDFYVDQCQLDQAQPRYFIQMLFHMQILNYQVLVSDIDEEVRIHNLEESSSALEEALWDLESHDIEFQLFSKVKVKQPL